MPRQPQRCRPAAFSFSRMVRDGHVTLSVGSCDGLQSAKVFLNAGRSVTPRRWSSRPLRASKTSTVSRSTAVSTPPRPSSRATRFSVARTDRRKTSSKVRVLYTLNNTGPLNKVAPPCPKKGVIGKRPGGVR